VALSSRKPGASPIMASVSCAGRSFHAVAEVSRQPASSRRQGEISVIHDIRLNLSSGLNKIAELDLGPSRSQHGVESPARRPFR
jgi:hypothetical protein